MNVSINWFDDISPSSNLHLKPSASSQFLRSYQFGGFSKKRSNLRITPACTPKKPKLRTNSSVVVKGNCAPPTPIITNNMLRAYVVKGHEMCQYFKLLNEDAIIKRFLDMDKCYLFADKYFLAMIFAHFKRCNFALEEYTRINFFLCLYLIHDVEEDNEDLKYEIFPWTLGPYWRSNLSHFLEKKDELWARMNYRAIVSRKCCEELMSIFPEHDIWKRERQPHHGGAIRSYMKDLKLSLPRGPNLSPKDCVRCHPDKYLSQTSNSLHDSAFSSLWECDSNNSSSSKSSLHNIRHFNVNRNSNINCNEIEFTSNNKSVANQSKYRHKSVDVSFNDYGDDDEEEDLALLNFDDQANQLICKYHKSSQYKKLFEFDSKHED